VAKLKRILIFKLHNHCLARKKSLAHMVRVKRKTQMGPVTVISSSKIPRRGICGSKSELLTNQRIHVALILQLNGL